MRARLAAVGMCVIGVVAGGLAVPAQAGGAQPPPCQTRWLQLSVGPSEGAAGTTYTTLALTNVSGPACTLYGWPGVSFMGRGAREVGWPASRVPAPNASRPSLVLVRPGASVHAFLAYVDSYNPTPATCRPARARSVRVFPPNQRAALRSRLVARVCTTPRYRPRISFVQSGRD